MKILSKNKPNSNPIQTQSKPILGQFQGWQTQTNPILSSIWAHLLSRRGTNPVLSEVEWANLKSNQGYFYKSVVIAPMIRYTAPFTTIWNQVDWTLTDMILTQILQPNCVKVPIESKEKEDAITELIDLLDANGLLSDRDVALDAVITRERIRSTGTGAGIAIPHGKCKAVKEIVIAIGIAQEPIEFGSVDGKPVNILFLLVSPVNQTGPHIQALAAISRLMLNEEFKQKLEQAVSAEEVYGLLNEIEK